MVLFLIYLLLALLFCLINFQIFSIKAKTTSTNIIPVGILNIKDVSIPLIKLKAEKTKENRNKLLKLLAIFLEIRAGNTIKLETSNVPTSLIPKTVTDAINNEINNL